MTRPSRRCMRNVFLACAALAASAVTGARADNLLGNADFEMPDASAGDVPVPTQGGGNVGSGGQGDWVGVVPFTTYYTQTHFLTGKQSGKMFGINNANPGLFQQTVAVAHDTDTFTASVYMLNASNDALKGKQGGFINMDFFDADGNMLATVTGGEEGNFLSPSDPLDVWKLVKVTAPGVKNTAYVQVDLVCGPYLATGSGANGGAVFVDDADFEETGLVVANWISPTNGSWQNGTNWSNSVVPQHAGDSAVFGNSITGSPTTVTLDGTLTVGSIIFNNGANSYTIAPGTGGTLFMNNVSSAAAITVQAGHHTISANLSLSSPTVVTVTNPGDSLTLSGGVGVAGTGGASFTKAGAGLLIMSNVRLPTVSATAGTLQVAPDGGANGVSVIGSLTISPGATFDLSDNDLIVPYAGNATPAATIRGYLASAYNNGAWDAAGLTSSTAKNDATHRTALGYAEATDVGITTFDGQTITTPFAVLVKYTYYGDSSLDGKVDLGNDFTLFLAGYLGGGSSWELGDYNYDGKVDTADFDLFVDGFKAQGQSLGALDDVIEASPLLSTSQKAALLSAVPEPASLGVLIITAFAAPLRRRRKA